MDNTSLIQNPPRDEQTPLQKGELLYRFEDPFFPETDTAPRLVTLRVLRTTPAGGYVGAHKFAQRLIRFPAKRAYAHRDPHLALEAWRIRKRRQLDYCVQKLRRAMLLIQFADPVYLHGNYPLMRIPLHDSPKFFDD